MTGHWNYQRRARRQIFKTSSKPTRDLLGILDDVVNVKQHDTPWDLEYRGTCLLQVLKNLRCLAPTVRTLPSGLTPRDAGFQAAQTPSTGLPVAGGISLLPVFPWTDAKTVSAVDPSTAKKPKKLSHHNEHVCASTRAKDTLSQHGLRSAWGSPLPTWPAVALMAPRGSPSPSWPDTLRRRVPGVTVAIMASRRPHGAQGVSVALMAGYPAS